MSISESETLRQESQRKGIWLTVVSITVVIALFMGLFLHKLFSPRILSPAELRVNDAIMFDQPRVIKPFDLLDHRNQAFTLDDLQGKWTMMYFGFTHCPDICPTALADLSRLTKILDPDVRERLQIVMVSVDPARDTPEVLGAYVPYFNDEFIGVTGEFPDIMTFTQNVNVAFNKVVDGESYTVDHTGNLVLINPKGHYHGFFKPPFEQTKMKLTFTSIQAQF